MKGEQYEKMVNNNVVWSNRHDNFPDVCQRQVSIWTAHEAFVVYQSSQESLLLSVKLINIFR